jgi:hypothetical protein
MILGLILLSSFVQSEQMGCGRSGIKGHLYLEKGNRMPAPDAPVIVPKGIKTTLYIYELTNLGQVARDANPAFYKTISTTLVKQVESAEDGSFKTKLNPGKYSLFVKKGDLFYSNIFDGDNNIYPVEVKKGAMTEVVYRVNYDAVY